MRLEGTNCTERPGRVLVAMSGGVDSSVAVALMKERGYDCIGGTMETTEPEPSASLESESSSPVFLAARAANDLGIPHQGFDFREDFARCVVEPFMNAYLNGSTPNPCVFCNRRLKFGRLLERAKELGCDKVATGHYVRVRKNEGSGRFELLRGVDASKDQSYVLYMLTQEQLSCVEFPLGEYTKQQVRELAKKYGLRNAESGESQDICFIPDGNYEKYIRERADQATPSLSPGNFVDKDGNVLGTHRGLVAYTIGQRRGLGLPGTEPWYVTELRPATNEVVLGKREEATGRELVAENFNWLSVACPASAFRASAKARYRHEAAPCEVTPLPDGLVRVVFDEPQWAITRGQAVVLYDGERVLGGGTIV